VIQLAGSSSKIEHITYEEAYGQKFDDMARRVPKLEKIRSVIDFSPRNNLDAIIKSVIAEQQASTN